MKKTILFALILLTCCTPKSQLILTATAISSISPVSKATVTDSPNPILHPLVEAFQQNTQCPNLCWLGIHPGTTTAEQAIKIFKNTEGKISMQVSDHSINGEWFSDKEKKSPCSVTINFSNGVVDSLTLGSLAIFTVSDFVNILGEPSRMTIQWAEVGDGDVKLTDYTLYYPELRIEIQANSGGWGGPSPDGGIIWLRVNTPPRNAQYFQPWLGYGHLQDYSPRAVPTPNR